MDKHESMSTGRRDPKHRLPGRAASIEAIYKNRVLKRPMHDGRRMEFSEAMIRTKPHDLDTLVKRAVASDALSPPVMREALNKLAGVKDYTKSVQLVRAAERYGKAPGTEVMNTLMNTAVRCGQWQAALSTAADIHRRNLHYTAQTYSFVILACGEAAQGARWVTAMRAFGAMRRDAFVPNSRTVASIVAQTRMAGQWQLGLTAYAQVQASTTAKSPWRLRQDAIREAMTSLVHGHAAPARSMWQQCLRTVAALPVHSAVSPSVRLVNMCIALAGKAGAWRAALDAFSQIGQPPHFKGATPSVGTYAALALAAPSSPAPPRPGAAASAAPAVNPLPYLNRVLNHALTTGDTPLSAELLSAVFRQLQRAYQSDESLTLFNALRAPALADPGNTKFSLGAMATAMLDGLLAHPGPDEALLLAERLQPALTPVLPLSTSALVEWGAATERWTAAGRVAVVDESVLLRRDANAVLTDLLGGVVEADAPAAPASAYDGILIPPSTVRRLVRLGHTEADDGADPVAVQEEEVIAPIEAQGAAAALRNVSKMVFDKKGRFPGVRFLPVVHQLQANRHVLRHMRDTRVAMAPAPADAEAMRAAVSDPRATKLLSPASNRQVWRATPAKAVATQTAGALGASTVDAVGGPANAATHGVAVALMLQRLNPDATVHVVTDNDRIHSVAAAVSTGATTVQSLSTDAALALVRGQRARKAGLLPPASAAHDGQQSRAAIEAAIASLS